MTTTAVARRRGVHRRLWRVGVCQYALEMRSFWGVVMRLRRPRRP